MTSKQWLWTARTAFAMSLGLFALALAQTLNFDGLICRGLDVNLGHVDREKPVRNILYLTNLAFTPVTIYQQPTCGCQVTEEAVLKLAPFTFTTLAIPYRVAPEEKGVRTRTTLLYAQRGVESRKITGQVRFVVDRAPIQRVSSP